MRGNPALEQGGGRRPQLKRQQGGSSSAAKLSPQRLKERPRERARVFPQP